MHLDLTTATALILTTSVASAFPVLNFNNSKPLNLSHLLDSVPFVNKTELKNLTNEATNAINDTILKNIHLNGSSTFEQNHTVIKVHNGNRTTFRYWNYTGPDTNYQPESNSSVTTDKTKTSIKLKNPATSGESNSSSKVKKGFLKLPVKHQLNKRPSLPKTGKNKLTSHQALEPSPLKNKISYYSVELEIGNPPQKFEVDIDTGSSDLWVLDSSTNVSPSYNANKSSSFKHLQEKFNIDYLQGSAKGYWATDKVSISDIDIKDQQFGVVKNPEAGKGILGVGRIPLEAAKDKYPNLPQKLVDQGAISHNAYSLYLDNIEGSSGSILFGGLQSCKYKGQLYTVPMTDDTTLQIDLNKVIAGKDTAVALPNGQISALVDSGTSLTYLEDSVVAGIAKRLGAKYDAKSGYYFIDKIDDSKVVTFDFSGAQITMPPEETFMSSDVFVGGDAPTKHMLSIAPYSQSNNYTLLGDSFLRATYAVFDLQNKEISFAQASYDAQDCDVQIIDKSVPGAKHAPRYS